MPKPFKAAGRFYVSAKQLMAIPRGEWQYLDCYGRRVVYDRERFPCFDSFDLLYENRYYHTYLIEHGKSWTLVKFADERPDVRVIENLSCEDLKAHVPDSMLKLLG